MTERLNRIETNLEVVSDQLIGGSRDAITYSRSGILSRRAEASRRSPVWVIKVNKGEKLYHITYFNYKPQLLS